MEAHTGDIFLLIIPMTTAECVHFLWAGAGPELPARSLTEPTQHAASSRISLVVQMKAENGTLEEARAMPRATSPPRGRG